MSKQALVEVVAETAGLSRRSATKVLDVMFAELREAIRKGGRFEWPGFGVWDVSAMKARTIRHPINGKPLPIPKLKRVRFRPAKALKEMVQ